MASRPGRLPRCGDGGAGISRHRGAAVHGDREVGCRGAAPARGVSPAGGCLGKQTHHVAVGDADDRRSDSTRRGGVPVEVRSLARVPGCHIRGGGRDEHLHGDDASHRPPAAERAETRCGTADLVVPLGPHRRRRVLLRCDRRDHHLAHPASVDQSRRGCRLCSGAADHRRQPRVSRHALPDRRARRRAARRDLADRRHRLCAHT